MKILMIEDDKATIEVIRLSLEIHSPGSTIKSVEKGREGLESVRTENYDVVVLDLGLPDIDGINVLEELRTFSNTPVLVISARHEPDAITSALSLGAQDYILKPFNFRTFISSLEDISVQPGLPPPVKGQYKITPGLTIDQDRQKIILRGNEVELTAEEQLVLDYLMEHRGKIVTVRELSRILSENAFAGDSTVHLVINRLRKKLGDDPYVPQLIIAEYECGYRFIKSSAAAG
jgi:DNA-binding response OmpR family regulator